MGPPGGGGAKLTPQGSWLLVRLDKQPPACLPPIDVVKTRMMNQDPRNPTYRGSVDCLVRTLRSEGWRGLYKGFLPTWARLAPWQLAFWTSYEQIRRLGGLQPF